MMRAVQTTAEQRPWTVRVWKGTRTEPQRHLLAEGGTRTLDEAGEYTSTTAAAATLEPGEYLWAQAISGLDSTRLVSTCDAAGRPGPWVQARDSHQRKGQ